MEGKVFIVCLRERKEQVPGLIHNIRRYFPNDKILFAVQADNSLFKRGQLFNLAFKEVEENVLVFLDVDYRFLNFIDIGKVISESAKPINPFEWRQNVNETSLGIYENVGEIEKNSSYGGCIIFTREQFVKCNGYSNLYFGWGYEDTVLGKRTKTNRLPYVMGHVNHPSADPNSESAVRNAHIYHTEQTRQAVNDSFRETIADRIESKALGNNIFEVSFTNIRVPPNFKYMDIYKGKI